MINPESKPTKSWGFSLSNADGEELFFINFNQLQNSAQVLNVIVELSRKTWASDKLVGEMVSKINSLLLLQKNYCTDGVDQGDKSPDEIQKIVEKNKQTLAGDTR